MASAVKLASGTMEPADTFDRTTFIAGKPYHWTAPDGVLTLNGGISQADQAGMAALLEQAKLAEDTDVNRAAARHDEAAGAGA